MADFLLDNRDMIAAISAAVAAFVAAISVVINTFYQRKQDKNTRSQLELVRKEARSRESEANLNKEELERIRERDKNENKKNIFQEIFKSFQALSSASNQLVIHRTSSTEFHHWYDQFRLALDLFQFRVSFLEEADDDYLSYGSQYLATLHDTILDPSKGAAAKKEDEVIATKRGIDVSDWHYLGGDLETRPKMSEAFYWNSPDILKAFQEATLEEIYAQEISSDSSNEDIQRIKRAIDRLREVTDGMVFVTTKTNLPPIEPAPVLTREEAHLDALIAHRGMLIYHLGVAIRLRSRAYFRDK